MLHNPIVSQAYTFRNFHIAREIGSSFVYVLSYQRYTCYGSLRGERQRLLHWLCCSSLIGINSLLRVVRIRNINADVWARICRYSIQFNTHSAFEQPLRTAIPQKTNYVLKPHHKSLHLPTELRMHTLSHARMYTQSALEQPL